MANYVFTITSFSLWMSKGGHDVFALVMGILGKKWVPKHITISLFEVSKTLGQTLTKNLQDLSEYYGLTKNSLLI